MTAERPVLHAVEAGNDPVADAGCGLTVKPEDAQAVAQGILNLLALGEDERKAMGQRGRAYILENHAYHVLALHPQLFHLQYHNRYFRRHQQQGQTIVPHGIRLQGPLLILAQDPLALGDA